MTCAGLTWVAAPGLELQPGETLEHTARSLGPKVCG